MGSRSLDLVMKPKTYLDLFYNRGLYLSNKFIFRNDTCITTVVIDEEIVKWGWLFLNLAPIIFEKVSLIVVLRCRIAFQLI